VLDRFVELVALPLAKAQADVDDAIGISRPAMIATGKPPCGGMPAMSIVNSCGH
jgi:hypothetical protein